MKRIIIILFILAPTVGFGQCYLTSKVVSTTVGKAFDSYGISYRTSYSYGSLEAGGTALLTSKFYAGNTYVLGVAGNDKAGDIDLYVYDSQENLIAKEVSNNKVSVVTFTPRYTDNFFIIIKMYDVIGTGEACWALLYGYQ
ncbi:MAG: hypothetical protein HC880_06960 [Bacteroidia bacterium]|nr:hypothetical protein [Bacteroidia bacterium]